ncbi:MAG: GNAT family N-acetyltransferase [Actinobacteria bacterium]|nr:GNAT family N-acetyltransferase [Actinomycetota bacterium]
MQIVLARQSDRAQVAAVDIEIIGIGDQDAFAARVAEQRLLVAVVDGEVVGYLAYGWLWDHLPTIYMLRIAEAARRRGVARSLVERLANIAAAQGHRWLLSSCDHDNAPSVAFHESLGFVVAGELVVVPTARELWWLRAVSE